MNLLKKIGIGAVILFFIGVTTSSGSNSAVKGISSDVQPTTIESSVSQNTESTIIEFPTNTSTPTWISYPTATPTIYYQQSDTSGLSNNDSYINSVGNEVHSPAYSNSIPAGATAQCSDGTYSFSQSRRGTCSHHGGVSTWL
jgi:hypothetical protein